MARLMRALIIVSVGLWLASCSRSMDEPSRLKFDLSHLSQGKVGAQSAAQVDFVAINISGPGMDRLICRYDEFENQRRWFGPCKGSAANPLQVEVPQVPAGKDRLIQVMAIVEEQDAAGVEQERFNYGESFQGLSAGDNAVNIQLTSAPAVTNKDGSAMGRYVDAGGNGYTGKVALQFQPPAVLSNGQTSRGQAMDIFHLEMFNGWFEIYLLDNIGLKYKFLESDHIMFGGPVDQTSPQFVANNPSVMTISSPQTYDDNGDLDDYGEYQVIGFWRGGSADGSASVCYDNTVVVSDYDYTDNTGTNSLAFPTDFAIGGGSGTCGLSMPLVTATSMNFGGELVLYSHGDGVIFSGPYQKFLTNEGKPDLVEAYGSGNQLMVNWKYLPEVTNSPKFAGTSVFYNATFDIDLEEEFEGSGGFDCSGLLDQGFSVYEAPLNAESVTISAGTALADKGVVIICPRRSDGTHFSSATGTGVRKAPAVDLKISGPGGNDYPHINQNACTMFEISGVDVNNNEGSIPASYDDPYIVSLSNSIAGNWHNDPGCSSAITGSVTIGMEYDTKQVYFMTTANTGGAGLGVTTYFSESVTLTSGNFNNSAQGAAAASNIDIYIPDQLFTTQCFPVVAALVDGNGVPTTHGPNLSITLSSSHAGATTWAFFDSQCDSSSDDSMTIVSGDSYGVLFFKPGPSEVNDTTLTTVHAPNSLTNGLAYVDMIRPPDADYMHMEDYGSYNTGVCNKIELVTYLNNDGDGQSMQSYPPQSLEYQLSTDNANLQFYSENSCSTGLTGNRITQSTSETKAVVWVESTASGSINISADELNMTGTDEFDGSLNITVDP